MGPCMCVAVGTTVVSIVGMTTSLVDGDDLVSIEQGRVWGPWCRRAQRCCGSYLLVGDTHTEHKQQVDRLANAEKRKNRQNWRLGPETPVCRLETPVWDVCSCS